MRPLFSGKVILEASLDKEVFYHGEDVPLHISINNQSKKQAKSIMVSFEFGFVNDVGGICDSRSGASLLFDFSRMSI